MTPPARQTSSQRWIEPLLAVLVASGLIYAMWHLKYQGYLPQPFFYEPADVWMDWFNTSYWAHTDDMYISFESTYPPISFLFLRVFSDPLCYVNSSAGAARECDKLGVLALHGFFVLNAILVAIVFYRIDRKTALPRAFALSAGLPMLTGLERGNLILPTFTFVLLAYTALLKSARLRWLAVGIVFNFKVYFIAAMAPQLIRRRWRWFEGALLYTVGVYLVTFAILGRGTPFEIYDNIVNFATVGPSSNLLDGWSATTYSALMALLTGDQFPINSIIGSRNVDLLIVLLPALLHFVQAMIVLAVVAAWLRPEAIPMYRLTNLSLTLALITAESGGYSQILPILFTFMEPWRGLGRKWAIVACYVLCFSFDIPIDHFAPISRDSYLGDQSMVVDYYLMLGPFVRPAIVLTIPLALSCVTIREVWNDIAHQGWRTRWRFRRDLPIMVGAGTAVAPQ